MSVLVDSNVLLDIFTEDATWFAWSADALERAALTSPLVINPIIYAEISTRFSRLEELNEILPPSRFIRLSIPYASAFLAGKVFTIIGAAAVCEPRRFRISLLVRMRP
jgi:predicted nucleic acid-binding protein